MWTTCLVFFQTALLPGYAYSDFSVRRLGAARAGPNGISCCWSRRLAALPIIPGALWKPDRTRRIRSGSSWGCSLATIGLPYFLLSTTSPLIQAWFARSHPGRSPYRLFALSNLASMLALLGYPFLLEPWVATCAAGLGMVRRLRGLRPAVRGSRIARLRDPSFRAMPAAAAPATGEAPARLRRSRGSSLWCALAATSSVPAAGRHQPHHAEHCRRSVPVDRCRCRCTSSPSSSASRASALVPARGLPGPCAARARRHGLDAGRPAAHARAGAPARRLLHRVLPGVHVLPRRARDLQAGAALPHALLPDDLAWAARLARCSSAIVAPLRASRLLRPRHRARRSARCCSCGGHGRDTIVSSAAGYGLACCSPPACGFWSVVRSSSRTRVADVAQFLRRAARPGLRKRPKRDRRRTPDPRHDHARQAVPVTPSFATEPTSYYTRNSGIGRLIEAMHPREAADPRGRDRARHRHARRLWFARETSTASTTSIRTSSTSRSRDFTYLEATARQRSRSSLGDARLIARARAAAAIRRPRHRRVLERRDPGAPHHPGGRSTCTSGT